MSSAEYASRARAALEAARAAGLLVMPATSQRLSALNTKADFGESNKQAVRALERRVRSANRPAKRPAPAANRPAKRPPVANISQALARNAVARTAASTVFAARAATAGPRGLAGSKVKQRREPYIRNKGQDDGYALNALTLNRIPRRRAVKVGQQYWDSKSLRDLLARDERAPNPLTRAPFPQWVYDTYGPMRSGRTGNAYTLQRLTEIAAAVADDWLERDLQADDGVAYAQDVLNAWNEMGLRSELDLRNGVQLNRLDNALRLRHRSGWTVLLSRDMVSETVRIQVFSPNGQLALDREVA